MRSLHTFDVTVGEDGFTPYRTYPKSHYSGRLASGIRYMAYVQSQGRAMVIIDIFARHQTINAHTDVYAGTTAGNGCR
ncbi:MAG TPA: hypothetical protein VGN11_08135 [Candidatus Baltobacteraceae bacterium]|nr:hypothetical protein [Candidatus Baltobacteraceae bacterium]